MGTNLRIIKPKDSNINDALLMSKILISKNWTLPPRTSSKHITNDSSSVKTVISTKHDVNDSGVVKKQQNRDAQRAYRERKANKIKEMEDSIETLQKLVLHWKNKYKLKEKELRNLEQNMKPAVELNPVSSTVPTSQIITPSKCGFCNDDTSCVCKELEEADEEKSVESITETEVKSETFNCSKTPSTCEKCSNIDETCIKPVNFINNEKSSGPDAIDFTFTKMASNVKVVPGAVPLINSVAFQRIKKQMQRK